MSEATSKSETDSHEVTRLLISRSGGEAEKISLKEIETASLNPDTVIATTHSILEREKALQKSAKK